jgi:hypothetical protein
MNLYLIENSTKLLDFKENEKPILRPSAKLLRPKQDSQRQLPTNGFHHQDVVRRSSQQVMIADPPLETLKAALGVVLDPLLLPKIDIDVLALVIAAIAATAVIAVTAVISVTVTAVTVVTVVTAVISATVTAVTAAITAIVIVVIAVMAHPPQQALHHLLDLLLVAEPPLAEAGEKEKLQRELKSNKKVEKRRTVMDLLKSNVEADGSFLNSSKLINPRTVCLLSELLTAFFSAFLIPHKSKYK